MPADPETLCVPAECSPWAHDNENSSVISAILIDAYRNLCAGKPVGCFSIQARFLGCYSAIAGKALLRCIFPKKRLGWTWKWRWGSFDFLDAKTPFFRSFWDNENEFVFFGTYVNDVTGPWWNQIFIHSIYDWTQLPGKAAPYSYNLKNLIHQTSNLGIPRSTHIGAWREITRKRR